MKTSSAKGLNMAPSTAGTRQGLVEIDGSFGEGGGQILRTSLALSVCTQRPFRISRIRAGRKKPGLLRQHLTAVKAAAAISGAEVTGAEIGSQDLTFVPGPARPGKYTFAIGTAGSATLVLQTVLPPLLLTAGPSEIRLEGGTHNQWAPPAQFLEHSFFAALQAMGADSSLELGDWGFYPAGGGKLDVRVAPALGGLKPLDLSERGNLIRAEILTAVSEVPFEVAQDEANEIKKRATFPITKTRVETVPSPGPGNVAMLWLEFEKTTAFFTGFGALGITRHQVARQVVNAANLFYKSTAAVEEHLADQLLVPMALAGGGTFTTLKPSSHTETNLEVIRNFIDLEVRLTQLGMGVWKIALSK